MIGVKIEDLFRSPGQIKVLRTLWRAGTPLTGRQIQGLSGLANLSAMQALERLSTLGIVSCRRAGRSYQYALRREHWAVSSLVSPMFEKEDGLLDDLVRELKRGLAGKCLSAHLFGSAVSVSPDPVGDLDLFVVLQDKGRKDAFEADVLPELVAQVSRRYGLSLEAKIVTREELGRRSMRSLLEAIKAGGRRIEGKDLETLITK